MSVYEAADDETRKSKPGPSWAAVDIPRPGRINGVFVAVGVSVGVIVLVGVGVFVVVKVLVGVLVAFDPRFWAAYIGVVYLSRPCC